MAAFMLFLAACRMARLFSGDSAMFFNLLAAGIAVIAGMSTVFFFAYHGVQTR